MPTQMSLISASASWALKPLVLAMGNSEGEVPC